MTVRARDIMQKHVLSVVPAAPLGNVQRMFFEEEIHGAPVVDDTGRVLGMLTSMDLVRCGAEQRDASDRRPVTFDYLAEMLELSPDDSPSGSASWVDEFGDLTVADAMTSGAISVEPDASVREVARVMVRERIHRVLVTEGDALCGIITSTDLVAHLAAED